MDMLYIIFADAKMSANVLVKRWLTSVSSNFRYSRYLIVSKGHVKFSFLVISKYVRCLILCALYLLLMMGSSEVTYEDFFRSGHPCRSHCWSKPCMEQEGVSRMSNTRRNVMAAHIIQWVQLAGVHKGQQGTKGGHPYDNHDKEDNHNDSQMMVVVDYV